MNPVASPADAAGLLASRLRPVGTERVLLAHAAGRVLAESPVADRDSPARDVSAMDGYAARLDALHPGPVRVCGEAQAGHEPPPLEPGCVVRIMTGAGVPAGADGVIRREDVREQGGSIRLSPAALAGFTHGQNIRRQGENLRAREAFAAAGRVVTPPLAGALATFGASRPLVRRRVRVATLVTGDEVRTPDDAVTPWQLRDSNGPSLRALLSPLPWVELLPHRHAADDADALSDAVRDLLHADAVFLTGGVSMGDRDYVPRVLQGLGAEVIFHRVAQRPGRPMLGAIGPEGQAVLALPGNPLSVLVTARRIGMAALRHVAGLTGDAPPHRVRMADDGSRLDLWWHRIVTLGADGNARPVVTRGSGDVPSAARSDGFVELPPGCGGGERDFYPWTPH